MTPPPMPPSADYYAFEYQTTETQPITGAPVSRVEVRCGLDVLWLTQDTSASTATPYHFVNGACDLTVWARNVVIDGPLSLPSRNVMIVADSVTMQSNTVGAPRV